VSDPPATKLFFLRSQKSLKHVLELRKIVTLSSDRVNLEGVEPELLMGHRLFLLNFMFETPPDQISSEIRDFGAMPMPV
jgi:hypothetical protein